MFKPQILKKIYKVLLLSIVVLGTYLCSTHDLKHTLHKVTDFGKTQVSTDLDTDCCKNDASITHGGVDIIYLVNNNLFEKVISPLLFLVLLSFFFSNFAYEKKIRNYLKLYFLRNKLLKAISYIFIIFSRGVLNPKLY